MKKIAIRVSKDFYKHLASEFIQSTLKDANIESVLFNTTDSIPSEDYQGLVLLTNLTDSLQFETDIVRFHLQSKPIIVFDESAKHVALQLRQYNPVIAVHAQDPEIIKLKKMGVDTEDCPEDDFITDRFVKVISSTIKLSDNVLTPPIKKGLHSLCKELVEMC